MIARIRAALARAAAWIRAHFPRWSHVLLLSRTVYGVVSGYVGLIIAFLSDHTSEIQSAAASYGAAPYIVAAIGLAIVLAARVADHISGANRA
jgi:hypothetical protein